MPSTTNYQTGDFVLVKFPFSGSAKSKTRPAVVLFDSGDDDIVVARVTTQSHQTVHEMATLEKLQIKLVLGQLQPSDYAAVSAVLNQMFGQW